MPSARRREYPADVEPEVQQRSVPVEDPGDPPACFEAPSVAPNLSHCDEAGPGRPDDALDEQPRHAARWFEPSFRGRSDPGPGCRCDVLVKGLSGRPAKRVFLNRAFRAAATAAKSSVP